MFLLRRIRDGLYYKNNHRQYWCDKKVWVENPTICTPFRSKAGAINSGAAVIKTTVYHPKNYNLPGEREKYYETSKAWHDPKNRPARLKAFYDRYELVEVVVVPKDTTGDEFKYMMETVVD